MNVLITGGTGFIGSALTQVLLKDGVTPLLLSRTGKSIAGGEALLLGPDRLIPENRLCQVRCVVNLAGENIGTRWTSEVKRRIYDSRVLFTNNLVASILRCQSKKLPFPTTLIQASAVGYYGTHPGGVQTEESPPGSDFLASLCKEWETVALSLQSLGIRVIILRFGLVLGPGGALEKMAFPFKLFMGGVIGSGNQTMSWIHCSDLIRFISQTLHDESISGIYNMTTPHPVTMNFFMSRLGVALGRPSWTKIPARAARLIWGEMADSLLLSDLNVAPAQLMARDFTYAFPELSSALANIFPRK